jgi:hypothetical protein
MRHDGFRSVPSQASRQIVKISADCPPAVPQKPSRTAALQPQNSPKHQASVTGQTLSDPSKLLHRPSGMPIFVMCLILSPSNSMTYT